MKVNGSRFPDEKFCVEESPDRQGIALVRFFENVQEIDNRENGNSTENYIYNEYHLELPYYDNIKIDIEANFDTMLNQAKIEEEQNDLTVEKLKEENDELKFKLNESKAIITSLQIALCNLYENSL